MKSFGRLIPVVCLCVFLSVDAFAASDESDISFVGTATAPGVYQLTIDFKLSPDSMSFLIFSQPDEVLLCAIISPDAEAQLIEQIEKMAPMEIVIAKLDQCLVKTEIPWTPDHENRFVFNTVQLQRGTIIIDTLAEVTSNNPEWIEFIMETDATGCMTMGRCGTGRPFWGPTCDPCEYTICCYGSTGFIQCGNILCP